MALHLSEPPEGHRFAKGQGETCGPQTFLCTRKLLRVITGKRYTQATTTALPAAQDDGSVWCCVITGGKDKSSDEATVV